MKNLLKKISEMTEKLERFLIMTGILAMMVNSTANAIGRYAFNKSIFFSEELNQFLIVGVTFIGFAYAVRKGRNIRMTAIYDSLSRPVQKVLTTVIAFCTSLLLFYLAYLSVFYVLELKSINRLSPALQMPVYYIYAIIPVGFAMAGLQYAMSFVMNLLHKEIYLSFDVTEDQKDLSGVL
ncbi:C4-dicarboxylate ABC transporter permease [Enterovibrio norvegicus FF-33]|uniref:TRAP transporter small permease protein n=1 Tax=Enterovibrio norvegicus FF-454 TaxID=1185651 RepID=A0A1E5C0F1_9GAMM|nr:TRAP transporter small permease [Enterovibrio norvegicus]OEE58996.1 C4-dicarboxylate ABC transporter permease [Enterovibrio norvegicus FF-454]OEE67848.1 C4-dicarboxylate ABC transporter permease [Enterovibrio norvegicus FF-33]OEE82637.1 C4-dicarboxylate ABC transporter permease [Enterovibrio norvegicus FF-162]